MSQKNKGLLLQLLGVIVLWAGMQGFYVLEGGIAYFIALAIGIAVFAALLFKGGALVKKSRG